VLREAQEEREHHTLGPQLHAEFARGTEAQNLLEGRDVTAKHHHLVMDLQFTYAGKLGDDSDDLFDAFTDQVLAALTDLEKVDSGLTDPDITATLSRREISITMRVQADTFADALRIFSANVRTALHVAGCRTANWPTFRPEGGELPAARRLDLQDA
jgi:hypothetical protein